MSHFPKIDKGSLEATPARSRGMPGVDSSLAGVARAWAPPQQQTRARANNADDGYTLNVVPSRAPASDPVNAARVATSREAELMDAADAAVKRAFDPKNAIKVQFGHRFRWESSRAKVPAPSSIEPEAFRRLTGLDMKEPVIVLKAAIVETHSTSPVTLAATVWNLDNAETMSITRTGVLASGGSDAAPARPVHLTHLTDGKRGYSALVVPGYQKPNVTLVEFEARGDEHMVAKHSGMSLFDEVRDGTITEPKDSGYVIVPVHTKTAAVIIKNAEELELAADEIAEDPQLHALKVPKEKFKRVMATYDKHVLQNLPVTDISKVKVTLARADEPSDGVEREAHHFGNLKGAPGLTNMEADRNNSVAQHEAIVTVQYSMVNPKLLALARDAMDAAGL